MQVRLPFTEKYRPKVFEDISSQELLVRTFRSAVVKDKHPSSWLICGPHGLGKTTMARLYSKAVLCDSRLEDGNPCNECESCTSLDEGYNPNYFEEDAGSNAGVEAIGKILKECKYPPSNAKKYKIVVLDECHMITGQAQAKLLKPMEEGFEHVIMMFLTTDPEKIKEQVRSRLYRVDVNFSTQDQIYNLLQKICKSENISYEDHALEQIAKSAKGHFRDSIVTLEQIYSTGELTKDYVDSHFNNNLIIQVSEMILDIYSDLEKALLAFGDLSNKMSPHSLWSNMLQVLNNVNRSKYLTLDSFSSREVEIYRDIDLLYKDQVTPVFDFLLKQGPYINDYAPVEQSIFMLNAYLKDQYQHDPKEMVEDNTNPIRDRAYRKQLARKNKKQKTYKILSPQEFAKAIGGELKS